MDAARIRQLAEKHSDAVIADRRYFHEHPELSFEEVETTRALKSRLEKTGLSVTTFPDYNGLVTEIRGGKPGPVVMLRSDIDGLPVAEKTGLPFASKNGKMHACGHDCHMAMLLGAVKILLDVRDEIPGTVRILFQSGEESCRGAEYYLDKDAVMKDAAGVFGMHIWGGIDSGLFTVEKGPRLASCDNFRAWIDGVSAHGSAPQSGKDAIVAAASVIMNLQTYVSRVNNPQNPLVVTVGTIHGGQRLNIIANRVELEGTIRTYSRELRATLEADLRRIITGTAETLGCAAGMEYITSLGPVVNDADEITDIAREAARKLYGDECLISTPPIMASEDIAMLMEKLPGHYCFLGCRNETGGHVYPNHNDRFNADESALKRGAALYAQFALDFLEGRTK